jgi:hypothetical protein
VTVRSLEDENMLLQEKEFERKKRSIAVNLAFHFVLVGEKV